MNYRKILLSLASTAIIASLTACGSGKSNGDHNTGEQNSELTEALQNHDLKRVSSIADSMAMYVDELTPDETVTVLMAFLEVHNEAAAAGDRMRDLETIRKFVDVYDIASGINPNDFRAAVAKANRINPNLNFAQLVEDFRDKLAEYEASAGEPDIESSTVKTDSVAKEATPADPSSAPDIVKPDEGGSEVPVEHRPAE